MIQSLACIHQNGEQIQARIKSYLLTQTFHHMNDVNLETLKTQNPSIPCNDVTTYLLDKTLVNYSLFCFVK